MWGPADDLDSHMTECDSSPRPEDLKITPGTCVWMPKIPGGEEVQHSHLPWGEIVHFPSHCLSLCPSVSGADTLPTAKNLTKTKLSCRPALQHSDSG